LSKSSSPSHDIALETEDSGDGHDYEKRLKVPGGIDEEREDQKTVDSRQSLSGHATGEDHCGDVSHYWFASGHCVLSSLLSFISSYGLELNAVCL
jgi:hypothetical protein